MGPERQRRLVAVVLLSLLVLLTSWLEGDDGPDQGSGIRSSVASAAKRMGRSLGVGQEDGQGKKKKGDYAARPLEEGPDALREDHDDDEDGDEDDFYSSSLKSKSRLYVRTTSFHFDFQSCLPRFICEVHSVGARADLTDLEKDIIGLFRNYVVLEGPGSPVYHYQLAAHMGHLLRGLEPSPCHNLYSSCPLSRLQLIDVLRNVKGSRRMLY